MQRLAVVARKRAGLGYRLLRQMILSARKGEDRIRLTASPKSFPFSRRSRRKETLTFVAGKTLLTSNPT